MISVSEGLTRAYVFFLAAFVAKLSSDGKNLLNGFGIEAVNAAPVENHRDAGR